MSCFCIIWIYSSFFVSCTKRVIKGLTAHIFCYIFLNKFLNVSPSSKCVSQKCYYFTNFSFLFCNRNWATFSLSLSLSLSLTHTHTHTHSVQRKQAQNFQSNPTFGFHVQICEGKKDSTALRKKNLSFHKKCRYIWCFTKKWSLKKDWQIRCLQW
jgi:hypothetical protein